MADENPTWGEERIANELLLKLGARHFGHAMVTRNVNLVAVMAGNPFDPPRMFRHGFIDKEQRERNFTAIFDDFIDEIDGRKILLDHILASPGIFWDLTDGRVEHDVFDAQIDHTAEEGSRQHLPSDHRPQSVTF
ncbi:MAG: hypothetical protein U9Q81_24225 [Pseudomonadota bacterium]|nr:hypothetical protein [Pseudomonadota bacterium]